MNKKGKNHNSEKNNPSSNSISSTSTYKTSSKRNTILLSLLLIVISILSIYLLFFDQIEYVQPILKTFRDSSGEISPIPVLLTVTQKTISFSANTDIFVEAMAIPTRDISLKEFQSLPDNFHILFPTSKNMDVLSDDIPISIGEVILSKDMNSKSWKKSSSTINYPRGGEYGFAIFSDEERAVHYKSGFDKLSPNAQPLIIAVIDSKVIQTSRHTIIDSSSSIPVNISNQFLVGLLVSICLAITGIIKFKDYIKKP